MPSNACSRWIDEFIAFQYSTTQIMTKPMCDRSTSSFVAFRPYLKQLPHMPPIFSTLNIASLRIFFFLLLLLCLHSFVCQPSYCISIHFAFIANFHAFLFAFQSSSEMACNEKKKTTHKQFQHIGLVCRRYFWHLLLATRFAFEQLLFHGDFDDWFCYSLSCVLFVGLLFSMFCSCHGACVRVH